MLRSIWTLTWLETKIFLREPMGFIGSVVIPLLLFLGFGRALGTRLDEATAQAAIPLRVGLPVFVAVFVAISAVVSLVAVVAIYRQDGILKRLRATPLSPITILVSHVLVKLLMTTVTIVGMLLLGRRYYSAGDQVPLVDFTLAVLLSTWSILSIGFVIASLVRTARFAPPLGSLVFYAMLPFCGLFAPVDSLPPTMQTVSAILPLTYAVSLLAGIWQGYPWSAHLSDIAALSLIFVMCTMVASRVFRWE